MTREEKATEMDKRIIDTLLSLMEEKALEDLTSDEIAKAVSMSKRTLYRYYSSKKLMYLGIIKQCFMELFMKIEEIIGTIDSKDVFIVLESIYMTYIDYLIEHPKKAQLMEDYNELLYVDEHKALVDKISSYANFSYLFKDLSIFHDGKNIELFLFIWTQIQGLSSVLIKKEKWISSYYGIDREKLIKSHLELMKKVVKEVLNEKNS